MHKIFGSFDPYRITEDLKARLFESLAFCIQELESETAPSSFKKLKSLCDHFQTLEKPSGFVFVVNDILLTFAEGLTPKEKLAPFLDTLLDGLDTIRFEGESCAPRCIGELTEFEQKITRQAVLGNLPAGLDLEPVSKDKLQQTKQMVQAAWAILKKYLPEEHLHSQTLARQIILLDMEGFYSATTYETMGNLHIRGMNNTRCLVDYVEALVHETTHVLIFALTTEDELVLNPVEDLFPSTLRTDLRPMMGVFHAFCVLSRNIMVFEALRNCDVAEFSAPDEMRLQEIFDLAVQGYLEGLETIEAQANLTPMGQEIIESCKRCVAPILSKSLLKQAA